MDARREKTQDFFPRKTKKFGSFPAGGVAGETRGLRARGDNNAPRGWEEGGPQHRPVQAGPGIDGGPEDNNASLGRGGGEAVKLFTRCAADDPSTGGRSRRWRDKIGWIGWGFKQ
jgi:hypothetical protein